MRLALIAALAVAGSFGCGSGGPRCAGAGGGGAAGGGGGGADGGTAARDAAPRPTDGSPDAPVQLSCAAATDAGASCIDFDPGYPDPAAVCATTGGGPVLAAACPPAGSAGGCHVASGGSGYVIWSYAPQTVGAVMRRCEELGFSYVSPAYPGDAEQAAVRPGLEPLP
jgi:hypothetical protein